MTTAREGLRIGGRLRRFLRSAGRCSLSWIVLLGMTAPAARANQTVQAGTGQCLTQVVLVTLAAEQISFCAPTLRPFQVIEDNIAIPDVPYAQLNQASGYGILNIRTAASGSTPGPRLPVYKPGQVDPYRQAVRDLAAAQPDLVVSDGPAALLWNDSVPGLQLDATQPVSSMNGTVRSLEWDVEHSGRLWIISMAWDTGMPNADEWQAASLNLAIQNPDSASLPDTATDLGAAFLKLQKAKQIYTLGGPVDVGAPAWWSGTCDDGNYYPATGVHSVFLAAWHGVSACGPVTYKSPYPSHVVQFFSGAWGEIEFECVELVMRFLYLEWAVHPWSGNANTIKDAPPAGVVFKANGSHTVLPGDVLTEDASGSNQYGHTAVITGVSLDGNGSGSINILEQNTSSNGNRALSVNNWTVQADPWTGLPVQGWLHVNTNLATATPTPTKTSTISPTPSDSPTTTLTFTPSSTRTPTNTVTPTFTRTPTKTTTPTPTFTPTPPTPDAPLLVSPLNDATVADLYPLMDWSDVGGADHYELQVATTSSFTPTSSIRLDQPVTASTFKLLSPLSQGVTYYWHVRAYNGLGQSGTWSEIWDFQTPYPGPTHTATPYLSPTKTPSPTLTLTPSSTFTPSKTPSATNTFTPSRTPTSTNTPSITPSPTLTRTPTITRTPTSTLTRTSTPTATPVRPDAPALIYPNNASLITTYLPRLDWWDVASADHYRVQISTSTTLSPLWLDQDNVTVSGYQLTAALSPNTTYYWRVRAIDNLGLTGPWSALWSFRTVIKPPVLTAPAGAALLNNRRPTFTWNSVTGADSYTLEVSSLSTFATDVIKLTTTSRSYTPTADLAAATKYYWHVRANGTNGPNLSATRAFTTGSPPSIPALLSPAANAQLTIQTPLLDWSTSSLPDGTVFAYYEVQVSKSSTFASITLDDKSVINIATSRLTTTALASGSTYFWRVRSVNTISTALNFSSWSAFRSFVVR